MATGERIDPYAGFNFLVEIDGTTRAAFSECSGLSTDTDPIEYRDGSEDITVRKIPGLKKFANISLKRGMTKDMELWTWRKTVLDGVTASDTNARRVLHLGRSLLYLIRITVVSFEKSNWTKPVCLSLKLINHAFYVVNHFNEFSFVL